MQASYQQYILKFKRPSGTSRGILTEKETWFLFLEKSGKRGVGECGLLRTLSIDDREDYEQTLQWVCRNIHLGKQGLWERLQEFPSIQFGVEMAFNSLEAENDFILFPSAFTAGEAAIPINGLVWMGSKTYMKEQVIQKLEQGFRCIKLKIGALDFHKEIDLLKYIRKEFSPREIEIRVDANGAFLPDDALEKLKRLEEFGLHSIEQPIKKGQIKEMQRLCKETPLPIALDEELIGVYGKKEKQNLLEILQPQFIILKPSLIGGFKGSLEWIEIAERQNIGWWITSALESNIGLNAIAQFTYTLENKMPQGLGTGGLYLNNFEAPLVVEKGELHYDPNINWNLNIKP